MFEDGCTDPLWEQEPLLALISAASVQGMVATDRRRLEQLCRYVVRPPVASGRLQFVNAETGLP